MTSFAEVASHEANSSRKANVDCTRSANGLSMWASVVNPNVPQSEAYPVLYRGVSKNPTMPWSGVWPFE
ncbi:MAG TPA: hypothetical protein DCL98_06425 [Flavobacteriales bacterium]|nr:hypothetical protein [Flavobacteriales bacterium]